MGYFNSSADSSIPRFLTNQQSLLDYDAYFYDLAEVSAEKTGLTASDHYGVCAEIEI